MEIKLKNYSKTTKEFVNLLLHQVDNNVNYYLAIQLLADNFEIFQRAKENVFKDGLIIKDRFDNEQPNKCIKIMNDAQIQLQKLLIEFGLTLKSNKKMNLEEGEEDTSALGQFLKNNIFKLETR